MKKLLLAFLFGLLSVNGWAKGGDEFTAKTNGPKKVQVHEYPSLQRHDLLYYDYDGDGVMEMFGYCTSNQKESFCLMNDEKVIKDYGINPYLLLYSNTVQRPITVQKKHFLRYVNGSGRIMIGPCIIDELKAGYGNATAYDVDNDGRMDIIKSISSFSRQLYDGAFLGISPTIISDSAYIAYLQANAKKYDPLEMNIIVHFNKSVKTNTFSQAVDLNDDGHLDFLCDDGKSAFLYVDENTYCQICFKGSIFPYDLDDDGLLDYLLYDGNDLYMVLRDERGEAIQKKIYTSTAIKSFVCRDFDHDGDVDVLVFVMDRTNTYFVFLRNDGNGSFKKKEDYLTYGSTLVECKDYDADGLFEILISTYYRKGDGSGVSSSDYNLSNELPVNKIVKVNSDFTISDVSEDLTETMNKMIINLGDFDNDGFTDFKMERGYLCTDNNINQYVWVFSQTNAPHMTGRYSKQTKKNTAPKKMKKPVVTLDESTGYMRIIWERGEDAETSSCDLTYEVRIGTAPGKGDILCAPSLPDGRRRVVADGSMGTQLQTFFNITKHKQGTYYVAVQAIDAGGLGGAWSDEAIYENVIYMAPKLMAVTPRVSTVDTLTVAAGMYDKSFTYNWSVSNGEVTEQTNNQAKVVFRDAGLQQVSLTLKRGNGEEYYSELLEVYVNAYKSASTGIVPKIILDINQNGYADGVTSYFVVNDGKGNLTKYTKSFNADINLYSPIIVDVNRDGFPDIVADSYVLTNDGEGEFESNHCEFVVDSNQDFSVRGRNWIDFFNTGRYNTFGKQGLMETNDYVNYNTIISNDELGGYIRNIYDINRDGFMDIISSIYNTDHMEFYAYINDGKGTFEKVKIWEDSDSGISYYFADINNDGYIDIIKGGLTQTLSGAYTTHYYYNPLIIYCGQPDNSGFSFVKIIDCSNCGIDDIHDYDNNGYLDLLLKTENGYSTIFFDQNFQYHVVSGSDKMEGLFIVMSDDGYPNNYRSTIKNQPPCAPATVSVKQGEHGMVINWSDAVDDHTPAMQMRYNVSVKRKGKTGENSYVISPMNGGSSKSNLVFPNYYKQSTTMTVPMRALTAGETYEVQVQAIDLWNQYSPMTAPVEITITDGGYIEVPNIVATGREAMVRYMGASVDNVTCTPGEDGTIVEDKGHGVYVLSWATQGLKTIKMGSLKAQIMVQNPVNVSFDVPETVYAGFEVKSQTHEEMAEHQGQCGLRVIQKPSSKSRARLNYISGSTEAELFFSEPGTYIVESYCNDSIVGNTFQKTINVMEAPKAVINSVSIDAAIGKYAISWPTNYSTDITEVEVMKEGTTVDSYYVLATAQVADGRFIDKTSQPTAKSERYKIALVTKGGQRIESEAHTPVHLMIGLSAAGGYNLMWNAYEGLPVDNYQILRGTSANNLTVINQLAGNQQGYCDLTAPEGVLYYAIGVGNIRSNVVSTEKAVEMQLATNLTVVADTILEAEGGKQQLYAILLPTYCYYNKVAWSIVEGNEYASISPDGLLTATDKECDGTEKVKVRVSTLDGSNLSDEITLSMKPAIHITVLVDDFSREYGDANPHWTYKVENGTLMGIPSLACDATPTSPVGTYEIVASEGTVEDEKVIFKSGKLIVTKASLNVSVSNYSREHGQENPVFEITYNGWKNNEDESVLLMKPVATTTATTDSPVGEYPITVSGGEAQNYKLSYVDGVLTVVEASGIGELITIGKPLDVYTMSGQKVCCQGTSLKDLPRGIYIIGGKKVVIR